VLTVGLMLWSATMASVAEGNGRRHYSRRMPRRIVVAGLLVAGAFVLADGKLRWFTQGESRVTPTNEVQRAVTPSPGQVPLVRSVTPSPAAQPPAPVEPSPAASPAPVAPIVAEEPAPRREAPPPAPEAPALTDAEVFAALEAVRPILGDGVTPPSSPEAASGLRQQETSSGLDQPGAFDVPEFQVPSLATPTYCGLSPCSTPPPRADSITGSTLQPLPQQSPSSSLWLLGAP
jgi:hypothetical protein